MTPAEKKRLKAAESRIDKAIGKRVRARREALDIRQDALGDHLGISGAAMSRYENGENSLRGPQLVTLAQVLKCRVIDLVEQPPETKK